MRDRSVREDDVLRERGCVAVSRPRHPIGVAEQQDIMATSLYEQQKTSPNHLGLDVFGMQTWLNKRFLWKRLCEIASQVHESTSAIGQR